MADYVKLCPQCGAFNQEHLNVCDRCGHFLGLVRPVPAESAEAAEPSAAQGSAPPPEMETPPGRAESSPLIERDESGRPHFYLESQDADKVFEVRSGQTVGQAHPSSRAEVQLSGLPNLNFVSRHHCRFDFEAGAWMVTALPSALNGTRVNQAALSPGGRARLRNGDEITLANVPFRVRMIGGQ
ncbi:MAG: FHA domain-containing protein [Thermodesulfobacteriota bacterium]